MKKIVKKNIRIGTIRKMNREHKDVGKMNSIVLWKQGVQKERNVMIGNCWESSPTCRISIYIQVCEVRSRDYNFRQPNDILIRTSLNKLIIPCNTHLFNISC